MTVLPKAAERSWACAAPAPHSATAATADRTMRRIAPSSLFHPLPMVLTSARAGPKRFLPKGETPVAEMGNSHVFLDFVVEVSIPAAQFGTGLANSRRPLAQARAVPAEDQARHDRILFPGPFAHDPASGRRYRLHDRHSHSGLGHPGGSQIGRA